MPIYEYQCTSCHKTFELIQKVTDKSETHCTECGQETAIRLVSAPGFQLKGTGWYVTDFRDKNKKTPEKATATESKADTAVVPKTEATPTPTTSKSGETD